MLLKFLSHAIEALKKESGLIDSLQKEYAFIQAKWVRETCDGLSEARESLSKMLRKKEELEERKAAVKKAITENPIFDGIAEDIIDALESEKLSYTMLCDLLDDDDPDLERLQLYLCAIHRPEKETKEERQFRDAKRKIHELKEALEAADDGITYCLGMSLKGDDPERKKAYFDLYEEHGKEAYHIMSEVYDILRHDPVLRRHHTLIIEALEEKGLTLDILDRLLEHDTPDLEVTTEALSDTDWRGGYDATFRLEDYWRDK